MHAITGPAAAQHARCAARRTGRGMQSSRHGLLKRSSAQAGGHLTHAGPWHAGIPCTQPALLGLDGTAPALITVPHPLKEHVVTHSGDSQSGESAQPHSCGGGLLRTSPQLVIVFHALGANRTPDQAANPTPAPLEAPHGARACPPPGRGRGHLRGPGRRCRRRAAPSLPCGRAFASPCARSCCPRWDPAAPGRPLSCLQALPHLPNHA